MSLEDDTRKHLTEALQERGAQARIAKELGVTATTVMRWKEGGEIPAAMIKLIRLYLLGEIPFDSVPSNQDLRGLLQFTPDEYRIIGIIARRSGLDEAGWIVKKIRDYLGFLEAQENAGNLILLPAHSASSFVAEETTSFGAKKDAKKANIRAAAGSPLSAEVIDWDGADDTVRVEIYGLSMAPELNDGDVVTMRLKKVARNPHMKKGLIYLVRYDGGVLVKRYNTRKPTEEEKDEEWVENGRVKILESINPEFPEIIIKQEVEWLAWLDKDAVPTA